MSFVKFKVDGSIYNKENLNKKYIDNFMFRTSSFKKIFSILVFVKIHYK